MKTKSMLITIIGALTIIAMLAACQPSSTSCSAAEEKLYIPVISKAPASVLARVREGAEKLLQIMAWKLHLKVQRPKPWSTNKWICCKPHRQESGCHLFRCCGLQSAIPLLEQAKAKGIPVSVLTPVWIAIFPLSTAATGNVAAASIGCRQNGRADRW